MQPTLTEPIRPPLWYCRDVCYMVRQSMVDFRGGGQSLASTLRERVLQHCIVSLEAVTEQIPTPNWFYRTANCTAHRVPAEIQVQARCSPSKPIAPVLKPFIVLR